MHEIRRVFLDAARRSHSDRPGGNDDTFKTIGLAGEILRDQQKRAEYDRLGDDGIHQIQAMFMTETEADPLESTVRAPAAAAAAEEEEEEEEGEEKKKAAGDAAPSGSESSYKTKKKKKPKHPAVIRITAKVTIEDLMCGTTMVYFYRSITDASSPMKRVHESKLVTIPPEFFTNPETTKLYLSNAGHVVHGATGAVIIAFVMVKHDWLRRSGWDLITTVRIRPIDLVLGGDIFVHHTAGTWIRVNASKIQALRFCLPGKGLPVYNGGVGDLYVEVQLDLEPAVLDGTAQRVLAAVFEGTLQHQQQQQQRVPMYDVVIDAGELHITKEHS